MAALGISPRRGRGPPSEYPRGTPAAGPRPTPRNIYAAPPRRGRGPPSTTAAPSRPGHWTQVLARAEAASDAPGWRGVAAEDVDEALDRSWPDLDRFTSLLTKESLARLKVLGPTFAEPLKTEARLRRKAYAAWLKVLDGPGLLPAPTGDLARGEALFDPNGGLPAEAPDAAKAAFARLRADRAAARGAEAALVDWERRAAAKQLLGGGDEVT